MKPWLVIVGAFLVMIWWLINGILMLILPARFDGSVWWPLSLWVAHPHKTTGLSSAKVRILGTIFAFAAACLLSTVIVPALVGLIAYRLKN